MEAGKSDKGRLPIILTGFLGTHPMHTASDPAAG